MCHCDRRRFLFNFCRFFKSSHTWWGKEAVNKKIVPDRASSILRVWAWWGVLFGSDGSKSKPSKRQRYMGVFFNAVRRKTRMLSFQSSSYENLQEVLENLFGSGYLRIVFPPEKFHSISFPGSCIEQATGKKNIKNSCTLLFILRQNNHIWESQSEKVLSITTMVGRVGRQNFVSSCPLVLTQILKNSKWFQNPQTLQFGLECLGTCTLLRAGLALREGF